MDGVKRHKKFLSWFGRILLLVLLTAGLTYLIRLRFHGITRNSDAMFLVGLLEVIIAGGSIWGSPNETSGSLWMRYLIGVPPNENRDERLTSFWADMFAKQTFAGQALLCGLVTILGSVVMSLVGA